MLQTLCAFAFTAVQSPLKAILSVTDDVYKVMLHLQDQVSLGLAVVGKYMAGPGREEVNNSEATELVSEILPTHDEQVTKVQDS